MHIVLNLLIGTAAMQQTLLPVFVFSLAMHITVMPKL